MNPCLCDHPKWKPVWGYLEGYLDEDFHRIMPLTRDQAIKLPVAQLPLECCSICGMLRLRQIIKYL